MSFSQMTKLQTECTQSIGDSAAENEKCSTYLLFVPYFFPFYFRWQTAFRIQIECNNSCGQTAKRQNALRNEGIKRVWHYVRHMVSTAQEEIKIEMAKHISTSALIRRLSLSLAVLHRNHCSCSNAALQMWRIVVKSLEQDRMNGNGMDVEQPKCLMLSNRA